MNRYSGYLCLRYCLPPPELFPISIDTTKQILHT